MPFSEIKRQFYQTQWFLSSNTLLPHEYIIYSIFKLFFKRIEKSVFFPLQFKFGFSRVEVQFQWCAWYLDYKFCWPSFWILFDALVLYSNCTFLALAFRGKVFLKKVSTFIVTDTIIWYLKDSNEKNNILFLLFFAYVVDVFFFKVTVHRHRLMKVTRLWYMRLR